MKIGLGAMFIMGSAVLFPTEFGKQASDPETLPPLIQKMGSLVETRPVKTSNRPSDEWMVHMHRNQPFIGCWATEDILVAATPHDCVQAFDAVTRRELWHRGFPANVYSVTASDQHVFVALGNSFPADGVVRLDLLTGEETTPADAPKSMPSATLSWSAEMNALWILHRGTLRMYSSDFVSLAPEISGCGSLLPESSPYVSCAGGLIMVAERSGLAHLIDPSKRTVRKIAKATMDSGIDSGSLRNAFLAADGRLIWVTDSGWNTGGINFQSGPDAPEMEWLGDFQGMPVAAVHWRSGRFVETGSAGGLSVFSTEGKILQQTVDVFPNGGVGSFIFSPSGLMLAALTFKGIQFFECK